MMTVLLIAIPTIASTVTAAITYQRTKELRPNGGSSILDKVDKIYRTTTAHERKEDE